MRNHLTSVAARFVGVLAVAFACGVARATDYYLIGGDAIDQSSLSGTSSAGGWATEPGGTTVSVRGMTAGNNYFVATNESRILRTPKEGNDYATVAPLTVQSGASFNVYMKMDANKTLTIKDFTLEEKTKLTLSTSTDKLTHTLAGNWSCGAGSKIVMGCSAANSSDIRQLILGATLTGTGRIVAYPASQNAADAARVNKITGDLSAWSGDIEAYAGFGKSLFTLEIVNATSIPADADGSRVTVTNGATLKVDVDWDSSALRSWDFGSSGNVPTLDVASGKTVTIRGPVYGSVGLKKTGAGTLTLAGFGLEPITITGTGTISAETLSEYASASRVNFVITPVTGVYYATGTAQCPPITVTDRQSGAVLSSGTDYTFSYTNNIAAGAAAIRVVGKGVYAGVAFRNFTIRRVVYSKGGANSSAKGTSWADAATFTNALYFASTSTVPVDVWVAGIQTQGVAKAVTFASETVVRGGFAGTETLPTQRTSGTRATVNANGTARALNFSNGATAPVTVERMIFTNGKVHNVERSGAGDVAFRDCDFTCCNGGTMYDGNGSGNANRNRGGSGASFSGTSPSVLTVERCHFGGNTGGGEWVSSGVGAWVSGFKSATFAETLFATNSHSGGRAGTFAAVLQVNGVPIRFTRCAFRGNYSNGGDFLCLSGNCGGTVFENCEVTGNYSSGGPFLAAGLGAAAQTIAITNCTFAYNYMGGNAEVRCTTGALTVHNSIFHRNHCASSLGFGVDVYVSGATSSGIIDWTYFDALSAAYYSQSGDSSLVTRDCVTGYDPLFVTSTEAFATLTGTTATPVTSKFNGTRQQLASFDVHLLSSEGYYDATGGLHQAADVLSGAVDGGDPADPVGLEKPGKNGNRINLGAYGGTQYASLTPVCEPSVENLSVTFDPQYTQPTITFTPGGTGVYSGSAVIKVSTNGTDWCYVSVTLTGLAKGTAFSHRVPMYFKPGDALKVSVELSGGGTTVSDSANDVAVVGVLPPWAGKGGGANVLHVRPGATGRGTGANWTDALGTVTEAIAARTAAITEIWFAGTNVYASAPATYSFAAPFAIRGGFTGAENTASERRKGARSVLDAAGKGCVLKISNSADVVLDGLVLTRGKMHDLEASGAGNLMLTNCAVTCCAGGTMYDGNSSGYANRDRGGAGLSLTGSGSATLTVVDSEISGNTASGEYVSSGVGGWITGYTAATFSDTLFATNCHNSGRSGCFAAVMQVNNVPTRFTRCAFRGNYCYGGDFLYLRGNCGGTVFENCEVTGNQSSGGPFLTVALGAAAQTVAITNCTFAYNFMGTSGLIVGGTGNLTVHNSIFHRNLSLSSSARGVDLALTADTATCRVDYSSFEALTSDYGTSQVDGNLTFENCIADVEPLFVTSTDDFMTLIGRSTHPRVASFSTAAAKLANLDVHLKSSAGYMLNDGTTATAEGIISPLIDAGDRADDYSREPAPNGKRINLGAFGGTAQASKSVVAAPSVDPAAITITFPSEYTQPNVAFTMGGTGIYSKKITVSIITNGINAFASDPMSGMTNGMAVSYLVPEYYVAGDSIRAVVAIEDVDETFTSQVFTVTGTIPPWSGRGGGPGVIHLRAGATGKGDGTSWTDAVTDIKTAMTLVTATRGEIWIAGDFVSVADMPVLTLPGPMTVRGGFVGTENAASERPAGRRSRLDGANLYDVMKYSSSYATELERLVLTRGIRYGLLKKGSGSLTVRECDFTCNGIDSWLNEDSANYRYNYDDGGAGASFKGSGGATLLVQNSRFDGNTTKNCEYCSSGVGAYVNGFTSARFENCFFTTNNPACNRWGYPNALQIVNTPTVLTNCVFRGNKNQYDTSVVMFAGSSGGSVVDHCLFAGNSCAGNGVLRFKLSNKATSVQVRNTTIAYNLAGSGCGVYVETGTVGITNSIVCYNVVALNSGHGADLNVTANGIAQTDFTLFGGSTTEYLTEAAAGGLDFGENIFYGDPLFVTATNAFKTLYGVNGLPCGTGSLPAMARRLELDLHLLSGEGYRVNGDDEWHTAEDILSPAIDKGDPLDPTWQLEPTPNGHRVNLGYYGGSSEASKSSEAQPDVDGDIDIAFGTYSQPTISFTTGGKGVYSANAYITVYTNGTLAWSSPMMTSIAKGQSVTCRVPQYYLAGDSIKVRVRLETGTSVKEVESAADTVSGELPPWNGKGGGAHVVHVRPGATGMDDGTSWTDAYTDLRTALGALNADRYELWIVGTNVITLTANQPAFTVPTAIRGGFRGWENSIVERVAGVETVIDGGGSYETLKFTNTQLVEIERLTLTRSSDAGLMKDDSAGDLYVHDCRFVRNGLNSKWGSTGNNADWNNGGAGARLRGTSAATLRLANCDFLGNTTKSDNDGGIGGGLFIKSFKSAVVENCNIITNYPNVGRGGGGAAGAYVLNTPVAFTNCAFRGNSTSAGDASIVILKGACNGSEFVNCVFAGNSASRSDGGGRGIVNLIADATTDVVKFRNCTFAYNLCGGRSALNVETGTADVKDAIFFGNVIHANATRGADVYLNTLGRAEIAWTSFAEGDFTNYVTAVSNDWLSVSNVARFDPLFVTRAADFKTAFKVSSLPRSAATFPKQSVAAALNVHLRGRGGYFDARTGDLVRFRGVSSPAIDAGDPTSACSREPTVPTFADSGRRINLGAYGNTPYATMTPVRGAFLRVR